METFDDYWARVMPRHMENARREWESCAAGPINGTVQFQTHEALTLNIPSTVVVHGLSEEAVAGKIIELLQASELVGVHDSQVYKKDYKQPRFRAGGRARLPRRHRMAYPV